MYVQRMHGSWLTHPFWRTAFVVEAGELERLKASGIESLDIDVSRGRDVDFERMPVGQQAASAPPPRMAKPATDAQADISLASELQRARRICEEGRDAVEAMFREVRMGRSVDTEAMVPLAEEITASVMRHPGALVSVARLKTADDYTYLHSVAVSALMASLARELSLSPEERRIAAMGGLLHDVGKAKMPLAILNKPGRLSEDEYAVMRQHAPLGEQALRESGVENPAVLHMVRHHHEKADGSGYPAALPIDEIPLLTRMSTVCDVYDAITSNRPYKDGWDPGESLRRMASWPGHFDKAVLKAFVRSLGIYPIGSLVRLSSERLAVVIEQRKGALSSPLVRVFFSSKSRTHLLPQDLDLSAPGCNERIQQIESPKQWGFRHLEKLWAD